MQITQIQVSRHGGPEVLEVVKTELQKPGSGEVQIRQTAIGLNFIDTYFRSGLYPPPSLPFVPGNEAVGEIIAIGVGVSDFLLGEKVVFTTPLGCYATARNIAATQLIKVPTDLDDKLLAANFLKAMTAEYLLFRSYQLKAGQTCLIHAGAGGVGQILIQWAKHIGARVIATAGNDEKCTLIKKLGADHAINYSTCDWVKAVNDLTSGEKCDVVYDSVGKDTFPGSLDCLKMRGMFVTFGNASGPVPDFSPALLSQKGSITMIRPTLYHYISTRKDLEDVAGHTLEMLNSEAIKLAPPTAYELTNVRQAHEDLESRKTVGACVLVP